VTLKLYNTRTRTKEEFQPLDPGNVRMYVCGPTVYDYAHIGNARPVIVFDVLYRLLRHLYGEEHVTYVRNITDVDDKINARAAEQYPDLPFNDAIRKLTEETAAQYHRDVAALGCLPPTHEPRATEYIDEMKAMIEALLDRGCAYVAENHVLFHVSAMSDYGQLARRSLDEMRAGARVEVAPYKRDPMDFVLWKPSKDGEPSWPSPRGINAPGRPGWHLECSAMAKALLGETFDIHGGGIDLVFPHHENEVAQSRCAHGTDIMANVWMHNGHLQVEGAKMSKSDGNFFTIDALLRNWSGYEIRLLMMLTHYRQPIDWTAEGLENAKTAWRDFALAAADVHPSDELPRNVLQALQDDLNTPLAVSHLHEIKSAAGGGNLNAKRQLRAALQFLALFPNWMWTDDFPDYVRITAEADHFFESIVKHGNGDGLPKEMILSIQEALMSNGKSLTTSVIDVSKRMSSTITIRELRESKINPSAIDNLIAKRAEARKVKNWAKADRIRDELAAMCVALRDAKDPATGEIVTTWEIAR
jgi:cysteinyl-tRNA synthetase